MDDRFELLKLAGTDEALLAGSRITDWLSASFFSTALLVHVVDHVRVPALAQCG